MVQHFRICNNLPGLPSFAVIVAMAVASGVSINSDPDLTLLANRLSLVGDGVSDGLLCSGEWHWVF